MDSLQRKIQKKQLLVGSTFKMTFKYQVSTVILKNCKLFEDVRTEFNNWNTYQEKIQNNEKHILGD